MTTATEWTSIRVRRETLEALDALRERLLNAYCVGNHRVNDMADGASLDAVIVRLLAQHRRHGDRRRRQLAVKATTRAKVRARATTATTAAVADERQGDRETARQDAGVLT